MKHIYDRNGKLNIRFDIVLNKRNDNNKKR